MTLRRYGKLPHIKYSSNANRNWFLAKRDKMRRVDYKAQEKLVEELYEDAFDSEGEHKVHTCTYNVMYYTVEPPNYMDTLGTGVWSIVQRLSLSRRFFFKMPY